MQVDEKRNLWLYYGIKSLLILLNAYNYDTKLWYSIFYDSAIKIDHPLIRVSLCFGEGYIS